MSAKWKSTYVWAGLFTIIFIQPKISSYLRAYLAGMLHVNTWEFLDGFNNGVHYEDTSRSMSVGYK